MLLSLFRVEGAAANSQILCDSLFYTFLDTELTVRKNMYVDIPETNKYNEIILTGIHDFNL